IDGFKDRGPNTIFWSLVFSQGTAGSLLLRQFGLHTLFCCCYGLISVPAGVVFSLTVQNGGKHTSMLFGEDRLSSIYFNFIWLNSIVSVVFKSMAKYKEQPIIITEFHMLRCECLFLVYTSWGLPNLLGEFEEYNEKMPMFSVGPSHPFHFDHMCFI
ncbi:hypothetical protein ACJX0J_012070, partial [Zea mays]